VRTAPHHHRAPQPIPARSNMPMLLTQAESRRSRALKEPAPRVTAVADRGSMMSACKRGTVDSPRPWSSVGRPKLAASSRTRRGTPTTHRPGVCAARLDWLECAPWSASSSPIASLIRRAASTSTAEWTGKARSAECNVRLLRHAYTCAVSSK
jgi:hypothetical protein